MHSTFFPFSLIFRVEFCGIELNNFFFFFNYIIPEPCGMCHPLSQLQNNMNKEGVVRKSPDPCV